MEEIKAKKETLRINDANISLSLLSGNQERTYKKAVKKLLLAKLGEPHQPYKDIDTDEEVKVYLNQAKQLFTKRQALVSHQREEVLNDIKNKLEDEKKAALLFNKSGKYYVL